MPVFLSWVFITLMLLTACTPAAESVPPAVAEEANITVTAPPKLIMTYLIQQQP